MILNALERCFSNARKRQWDKVYFAIDIHETIIVPNYQYGNIPTEFYPHAKETLQMLTKRKDVELIIFTCSHPEEIEQYQKLFKEHNISFKFINENPEVPTQKNGYGCYDSKFYFNVLFEDKAGFLAEKEWIYVKTFMSNCPELLTNETK